MARKSSDEKTFTAPGAGERFLLVDEGELGKLISRQERVRGRWKTIEEVIVEPAALAWLREHL